MKLINMLKSMFLLFCAISTFMFFFIAVQAVCFDPGFSLDGRGMLKVLLIALASVLPVLIFYCKETISREELLLRRALHFFVTAGIVLGLQITIGWMDAANAVYVVIVFLLIYIAAYTVLEIRAKKLADKLNERINAFHGGENETHAD